MPASTGSAAAIASFQPSSAAVFHRSSAADRGRGTDDPLCPVALGAGAGGGGVAGAAGGGEACAGAAGADAAGADAAGAGEAGAAEAGAAEEAAGCEDPELGGGAYPAVGIPHSSVAAPSWLRNQLCCICTKIGASFRSSAGAGAGVAGTGGIAARAAPQLPESGWAGAGVGAIGVGVNPFIVVVAVSAVTGLATRVGSGGRFGVGAAGAAGAGRCDGNIGSEGCAG